MNADAGKRLKVSTDKSLLDTGLIIQFLQSSYWGKEFSSERILKSIENSFCFGLFEDGLQVGFARVITDFTYTAWLADVFIIPEKQHNGYGHVLMKAVFAHEQLKDIIKWRLSTQDAHSFYAQFGFTSPKEGEKLMEKICSPEMKA